MPRGVGVQPASGSWGSVVWAIDAVGKTSAKTFYSKLEMKSQAKIQALFNALAKDGRIPTRDRFKKLENRRGWALWEFKSFQIRFIGAFTRGGRPGEFVVAHGVQKKSNRLRDSDLEIAARILMDHFRK